MHRQVILLEIGEFFVRQALCFSHIGSLLALPRNVFILSVNSIIDDHVFVSLTADNRCRKEQCQTIRGQSGDSTQEGIAREMGSVTIQTTSERGDIEH